MNALVGKHLGFSVRNAANGNDPAKRITIRSIADRWCECAPDAILPCGLLTCPKRARGL